MKSSGCVEGHCDASFARVLAKSRRHEIHHLVTSNAG